MNQITSKFVKKIEVPNTKLFFSWFANPYKVDVRIQILISDFKSGFNPDLNLKKNPDKHP